jgi:dienelactone hydrolase
VNDVPPHLRPFVVPAHSDPAASFDTWDLHLPVQADRAVPLVVVVHGGPIPADLRPAARQWPVFRGYAGLLGARGAATAIVEHPLHGFDDYPRAYDVVRSAVDAARVHPQVDASRVALWHFSGGAPLVSPWLTEPPPWLRCLALTYPLLDAWAGWSLPPAFRPLDVVTLSTFSGSLVVVRAGRESELLAGPVDRFLDAARASAMALQIVDVPNGGHGFDTDEPTEESSHAVVASVDRVVEALTSQ